MAAPRKSKTASRKKRLPAFVVGLGASAGGLEALERFFDGTAPDTGGAFVVVMHLSRDFKSVLSELLARHTAMKVVPVTDDLTIESDTVYVIQPGTEIEVLENKFRMMARPMSLTGRVASIDVLFRSIAEHWRDKGAAVVLSGSGSDGALGVTAVHAAGGFACAQSPETAKFDAMPVAAISTNSISAVDAPESLGAVVVEGVLLPRVVWSQRKVSSEEAALQRILAAVVGASHLDAAQYTHSTFERRVQRRMKELHLHSLPDYAQRVETDRNEARALSETLLIGVTDFFRDEQAFTTIERAVAPELIRRAHAENRPIRIWSAGCASGEEAYSLAMVFSEVAADFPSPVEIQIFATDVHRGFLAEAARGEYPSERMQGVSEKRQRTFFSRTASGGWQIDARIRKSIVFAPHDVLNDPPFTRLDLVSCRNLLIYFSVEAHQRVLGSFAFGLLERGFLFLGSSETVGARRDSFEFVDVRRRLFRRTRSPHTRPTVGRVIEPLDRSMQANAPLPLRRSVRMRETMLQPAYSALLNEFAPASLLISSERELLHSFGDARQYLRPPEGVLRLDVCDMVDSALKTPLAVGVDRALRDKTAMTFANVEVNEFPAAKARVNLVVKPLVAESGSVFALVIFEEQNQQIREAEPLPAATLDILASARIAELEHDLDRTREALQATIEEIETANEELQATNEELMSSNEELQSTNEELSSLNEELHSVNSEHFRQNDELIRLTRDFDALLHATEIGVLFIDESLNIRRFTRLAAELFNFADRDIGRPFATFRSPFIGFDMDVFLERALAQREVDEVEVQDGIGRSWLLRSAVYPDQRGIVLSIISISRLRDSNPMESRQRLLARASPYAGDPILIVAPETGKVEYANSAARSRLGLNRIDETAASVLASRLTPEWGDLAWISWLSTIAPGTEHVRDQVPVFGRDGAIQPAALRATIVVDDDGRHAVIRVVDSMDSAKIVRELQERSRRFATSNRELEQFASVVAHDLRAPLRHLNQFAGFLIDELDATASDSVREYIGIIQSSAVSMSGMIERLLDYARIGTGAPVFSAVVLNDCVQRASDHLKLELEACNALLSVEEMPTIDGDPALLTHLFQNLISNALKYRRPKVPPSIHITSKEAGKWIHVTVRDEGIGIPAAQADEIFKMFTRLHSDEEYSGHGMGLAICKRVCEIHGATVALDPGSELGASFTVKFPKRAARERGKRA